MLPSSLPGPLDMQGSGYYWTRSGIYSHARQSSCIACRGVVCRNVIGSPYKGSPDHSHSSTLVPEGTEPAQYLSLHLEVILFTLYEEGSHSTRALLPVLEMFQPDALSSQRWHSIKKNILYYSNIWTGLCTFKLNMQIVYS